MATYLDQQPRQFNKYSPDIDSQVYAQLLAKDDTDYQSGVQKVNSYIGAVAGLPVASEDERQYLQGLVSGVTSKVNQMVGANWSDQKVQGNIATQAGAIYGDEKVQRAIANASNAKRLVSDIEDDKERTKGQNTANQYVAMQKLNKWRSGPTLGTSFDGTYDNYIDAPKLIEDYWTKKHPDQKIRIEPGYNLDANGKPILDISKWDEVKHTWKGLRHDEVASEIGDFINTNPTLDNQLSTNAKYKYRNYGPQEFFASKKMSELSTINDNANLIKKYTADRVNTLPYSDEYQALTDKIDQIGIDNQRRQHYINNGLYDDTYTFATNPNVRDNFLGNIYKNDFINAQAKFYSYGEDNVEFIGDSPSKKYFEEQTIKQTNRTLLDKEKQDNITNNLNWLKYLNQKDLNDARILKMSRGSSSTSEGGLPAPDANMGDDMTTQTKVGPYQKVKSDLLAINSELEDGENKYMYNQLGKYADKYFNFDNGNIMPKDGTSKTKLHEMYISLQQRYQAGDPTLDQVTKDHFALNDEKNTIQNLTLQKIDRNEKAWDEYSKSNPKVHEVDQALNALDANPIVIKSGKIIGALRNPFSTGSDYDADFTITGKSINNYLGYKKAMADFENPNGTRVNHSEQEVKDAQKNLQDKYDLLPEQVNYYDSQVGGHNSISKLIGDITDLPTTKEKFLDDKMRGSQIYTAQQATGLFTTDKKYNEDIRHRAINIVSARDGKAKVLGEALNKFNISGTQDPVSKKFYLLLQDPTSGKKVDPVEITDAEASTLGMKDLVSIDPVLTRLSLNDDRGLGANTGDGSGNMTFDNSFKALTQKDPTTKHDIEYRYGVARNQQGWYVTIFPKDLTDNKNLDPVTLPRQSDWSTAKAKLNQKIGIHDKQRTSYSYDATIDNNVNRNTEDNIDDQD